MKGLELTEKIALPKNDVKISMINEHRRYIIIEVANSYLECLISTLNACWKSLYSKLCTKDKIIILH